MIFQSIIWMADFSAGSPPDDDVTLLGLEYRGPGYELAGLAEDHEHHRPDTPSPDGHS